MSSKKPNPKRSRSLSTLLIPNKRSLLPPTATTHPYHPKRILNPSAIAASIRTKGAHPNYTNSQEDRDQGLLEEESDPKPPRIEVSFSAIPQPFLDPPVWESILRTQRAKAAIQSRSADEVRGGEAGKEREGEDTSESGATGPETGDERRRRREREVEYGTMAIRGRSSLRGRGRRRGRAGGGEGECTGVGGVDDLHVYEVMIDDIGEKNVKREL
ncbi:hypothetical protein N7510_010982 [Penicillium lagena]|uniref:uncharacterized protein n=1 Tax=Penicillium lagena TaxID=94218 RepID=UPI00253FDCDB|nr:uncharacterized protein N7510_010982 [Penicillium lagena]KAJ5601448.1 hypothetical protein N7510_010982 [Penicillium lagena]